MGKSHKQGASPEHGSPRHPENPSRSSLVVEITGVAGAGKSSLAAALLEDGGTYVAADFIHTRKPIHLLRMIAALPRLTPILFDGLVKKPRIRWPDVKLMAYIGGWSRHINRVANRSEAILLLDQGPAYALVRLRAKGLGLTFGHQFERWWEEMANEWAQVLNLIVALDADDTIILERINTRGQAHAMKGQSNQVGREFLATYRSLFSEISDKLADDGVGILQFDTGDLTVQALTELVNEAAARLDQA